MVYTKEKAKVEIKKLIDNFDKEVKDGVITKETSEGSIRDSYVKPLFKYLNWREEGNIKEIKAELRTVNRKRVDVGFIYNNNIKFLIELKKVKTNLDNEEDKRQAYDYGYLNGVRWVILTNFESLIILDCYTKNFEKCTWKIFHSYQYLKDDVFDVLWLFNQEGFKKVKSDIEDYADRHRTELKREPVGELLYNQMKNWREELTNDIDKHQRLNPFKTKEEKDESIQLFLNRLIFIRYCEDKGLERNQRLKQLLEKWRNNKSDKLIKEVKNLFIEFDDNYDSSLFRPRIYYDIFINDKLIEKIIDNLYYNKDNSAFFDFSLINADVLGSVYEEYLEFILKDGKHYRLRQKHQHRKDFGQFYTPTYIVEYIVNNTVAELIKKDSNIKVLDCACGSGSFLIKACDIIKNATNIENKEILRKNLYGVDIDKKACEIAKLNLLLKALTERAMLPSLTDNIKQGNSIISGKKEELEKYFNNRVYEKKPFSWEEEFKFNFDVIIGNPPYVDIKGMDVKEVDYLFDHYPTASNRINLYSIFLERALSLLKDKGYFGYIIPNSILFNDSYMKIREKLLNETNILKIVRLPDNIFLEAKVETIILIFKKTKEKKEDTEILIYDRKDQISEISKDSAKQIIKTNQDLWKANPKFIFNIFTNPKINQIIKKIEKNSLKLIDICDFSLGLTPYDKYKGHTKKQITNRVFHSTYKKNNTFKPLLAGSNVVRYGVFWDGKEYISYGDWLGAPREQRFFTEPRILVRQIISGEPPRIFADYCDEELYNVQTIFNIIVKDKDFEPKYILALLNSKLINFYHTEKFIDKSKNLFQKILIVNAKQFPIHKVELNKQKKVIELVDKITKIKKQMYSIDDKQSTKYIKLEEEFNKLDKEIDMTIYEIYGLSNEEKEIIKGRLE